MFDVGWDEMALVAVVALIVIGPKDLPHVLRTAGQWMRKARELAGEFQRGVDDMVREAELSELKSQVEKAADTNALKRQVEAAVDPTGEIARSLEAPKLEQPSAPVAIEPPPAAEPAGGPAAAEPPGASPAPAADPASHRPPQP
ncbi:MAG: Sec-independent protein translocase protein TatB [Solirubrobacterales bacterium]